LPASPAGIVLAGSHDIFPNVVSTTGLALFQAESSLSPTRYQTGRVHRVSKEYFMALNRLGSNEPGDIVTDATRTPNVNVRNR
jgi:hypothetical protein